MSTSETSTTTPKTNFFAEQIEDLNVWTFMHKNETLTTTTTTTTTSISS